MWKLIKADFIYKKISLIFFYGILLSFFLANAIRGNLEQPIAYLTTYLIMFGVIVSAKDKSYIERVRFLSGLPLPVRKLGFFRYAGLIHLLMWAVLLYMSSIISRQGHLGMDYLCWILTKIGGLFLFGACMTLAADIRYCMKSSGSGRVLLWVVVWILRLSGAGIGFGLYFFSIPGPSFYSNWFLIDLSEMLLTFPASFGLFFVSFVLMVLDIYIFGMRNSYLSDSIQFS